MNTNFGFLIPEGMNVTGTLSSEVPGQIAGNITGDISVNAEIIIQENSVIVGNVYAHQIVIWGKVIGYIQCAGKLILQKGAFVKGNIRTMDIQIEPGAIVDGIVMKPGNDDYESEPVPDNLAQSGIKTMNIDLPDFPTDLENPNRQKRDESQSWF